MTRDLKRAAALRNVLAESKMPVTYLARRLSVPVAAPGEEPRIIEFQLEAITFKSDRGGRSYPARRICAEGIVVAAEAWIGERWTPVPSLIGWPAEKRGEG